MLSPNTNLIPTALLLICESLLVFHLSAIPTVFEMYGIQYAFALPGDCQVCCQ
jgi:hypothetical protein